MPPLHTRTHRSHSGTARTCTDYTDTPRGSTRSLRPHQIHPCILICYMYAQPVIDCARTVTKRTWALLAANALSRSPNRLACRRWIFCSRTGRTWRRRWLHWTLPAGKLARVSVCGGRIRQVGWGGAGPQQLNSPHHTVPTVHERLAKPQLGHNPPTDFQTASRLAGLHALRPPYHVCCSLQRARHE
jgi:hypothetical protein